MVPLPISIYILAFGLELAGGWIVAADIVKDKKDIQNVLEERANASTFGSVSFGHSEIGGAMGSMLAQNAARQNVMDDFTLTRIRTGYSRRWWGIALVALGALVGTVGNVVSTFQ